MEFLDARLRLRDCAFEPCIERLFRRGEFFAVDREYIEFAAVEAARQRAQCRVAVRAHLVDDAAH